MAKELMEIGGFITEGAEIVNHDNTLSGNGTVDSPLSVVPGYNETVLFDSDLGLTSPTLSGNPMEYERLKIYFGTQRNGSVGNNLGMNYNEVPTSILSGGRQGSYGFLTLQNVFWGNNTAGTNPYMAVSEFSGTTGTNWKIVKGMLYNLTANSLDQNNNWNYIYKIVGINRKA